MSQEAGNSRKERNDVNWALLVFLVLVVVRLVPPNELARRRRAHWQRHTAPVGTMIVVFPVSR